jgi:hypothetical protein
MPKKYKNVPVDMETYERLQVVCQRNQRKQGAQVRFWVDTELGRLELLPVLPKGEVKAKNPKPVKVAA